MRVLITGICGFVGCQLALRLREHISELDVFGVDNLSRPGSWLNVATLQHCGIRVLHGDIRCSSDLASIPQIDWVIDAAANPSVIAGVDDRTNSRQLVETNLGGTINLLELCRERTAGLILLSTSRVYSIPPLAAVKTHVVQDAFVPTTDQLFPPGLSPLGISEDFSTASPVSLYGATKLASEHLALEYAEAFGFPVFVNRCGVLAGAGQFAQPSQGIFAFWIHSFRERRPLRYIGFDGGGYQVRDCLHPTDLAKLIAMQLTQSTVGKPRVLNVAGGRDNSMSLRQLTGWCESRFQRMPVGTEPISRPYDLPWLVLDSQQTADVWNWRVETPLTAILTEIADFADQHPDWLSLTSGEVR